jgi:glycerol uptake facilitator-like aquaporin
VSWCNDLINIFLGYILAQVSGGVIGAALVYANYIHAINVFEGGHHIRTQATASLFATYAVSLSFEGPQFV